MRDWPEEFVEAKTFALLLEYFSSNILCKHNLICKENNPTLCCFLKSLPTLSETKLPTTTAAGRQLKIFASPIFPSHFEASFIIKLTQDFLFILNDVSQRQSVTFA